MVAETFIPNPKGYKEVDHIDNNKQNNHVTNLRWVTHSINVNNKKVKSTKRKPVIQYDLNNKKIAEFKSINDAGKQTGIYHTRISEVVNGTRKQIKGYIFKFKGGKNE